MINSILSFDDIDSDHYQHYPQMLPWVGCEYQATKPKVIFIGESHYLPELSNINLDPDDWYQKWKKDLDEDEVKYTNTSEVVRTNYNNNAIFTCVSRILIANNVVNYTKHDNVFEYFSYMNFFQRPAEYGKSINVYEIDSKIANETYYSVIKKINPEYAIFLSSKAWYFLADENKKLIKCDFTSHPSSRWWYRKAKKYSVDGITCLSGKERFEHIINSNLKSFSIAST